MWHLRAVCRLAHVAEAVGVLACDSETYPGQGPTAEHTGCAGPAGKLGT